MSHSLSSKTSAIGDSNICGKLLALAIEAGEAVMAVYESDFAVAAKSDDSPVTEADKRAEAIILSGLATIAPGIPVIAEEASAAGIVPAVGSAFFLVDPVDGTREFCNRNGDFTVNVALIRGGEPVIGVVFAPARGLLFAGRVGEGAERLRLDGGRVVERQPIHVAEPSDPPRIIASRSHRNTETDDFLRRYPGADVVSAGSSLKFCLIAAGEADLYPRLGPTMQWDTAAGDAILRAAGGQVTRLDGVPLIYGPGSGNGALAYCNPHFLARGSHRPDQRRLTR